MALLESADIDDFSFLGFMNAYKAENRRGIFSIGEYSTTKTPIVMIHGLNSDPLIWRYLTMAILNNEVLNNAYQIWHVYYPSGPPPFYNAMKIRKALDVFLNRLEQAAFRERAVFIGHSMGGVIAKTLTTASGSRLWDATFTEEPEKLLSDEDNEVKDIFIFKPTFLHNEVFFIDTPHRGSSVASSIAGIIGSSIVTLPADFKSLFRSFIDKVGLDKLTTAMYPFLQDYGPNSVQVLRPGHPLMTALVELPVEGNAYSIIGSTTHLACNSPAQCSTITDGVVDYDSAHLNSAIESILVESSHDSFQSEEAISFVVSRLGSLIK